MDLTTIATLITEIGILIGVIIPVIIFVIKLAEAAKCQLRSEMVRTYYRNKDQEKLHQYEYENFFMLYKAYKALRGNSFIDKIKNEIEEWEVIH